MNPLIIIPSRMASVRLPGKPLADIHGSAMVVHVMRRAQAANAGPVWVACSEAEVADVIIASGGHCVMTPAALPSGTDRVKAAADIIDPEQAHDVVINVQGDMPALDPALITDVLGVLKNHSDCDIATLVVSTDDPREKSDPNVVKAVLAASGRALYFTRAHAPSGEGPVWHHVGLYAYRRSALDQFCCLPPSALEIREKLEQLRALENGLQIHAAIVNAAPDGVDTPDDLERARRLLSGYKDV